MSFSIACSTPSRRSHPPLSPHATEVNNYKRKCKSNLGMALCNDELTPHTPCKPRSPLTEIDSLSLSGCEGGCDLIIEAFWRSPKSSAPGYDWPVRMEGVRDEGSRAGTGPRDKERLFLRGASQGPSQLSWGLLNLSSWVPPTQLRPVQGRGERVRGLASSCPPTRGDGELGGRVGWVG